MTRHVVEGASELFAYVTLIDSSGGKATGVPAANVTLSRQTQGAEPVEIALEDAETPAHAAGAWYEVGDGEYQVGLPVSLAVSANVGKSTRIFGSHTGGDLYGETLAIVRDLMPKFTGANNVDFTIRNASTNALIEGVEVRMTKDSRSSVLASDDVGFVRHTVEVGTFAAAFTHPRYQGASQSITVTGLEGGTIEVEVSLTPLSVSSPPSNDTVIGVIYLEEDGEAAVGALSTAVMVKAPASGAGSGFLDTPQRVYSIAAGKVEFVMYKGAAYRVHPGTEDTERWERVEIAEDASGEVDLDVTLLGPFEA